MKEVGSLGIQNPKSESQSRAVAMTCLALAITFALHQDTKTFTDPMLGLAFTIRNLDDREAAGKKPKPGTILISRGRSSSNATLEILRSKFSESIDPLATIQLRATRRLEGSGQAVATRRSQRPLLLTRSTSR